MSATVVSDKRIYLDYAATAPLLPRVRDSMLPYFDKKYGNPSSMHLSGRRAKMAIEEARAKIAQVLECLPEEIIFTGSGTESDNLAIIGVARAHRDKGDHIIVSAIEHKAVLEAAKMLEKESFKVDIVPVDHEGKVDIDTCLALINDRTILVSVMYANNEIGTIEPLQAIALGIKKRRGSGTVPLFHTDACQAAGFLPLSVKELGIDLMTLNSSKIYGPKGVGILYKKKGIRLEPLIVGGEQEMSLRAGTQSVPLIVGCAEALLIAERDRHSESVRLSELRNYFISRLEEEIPGVIVNGHRTDRLPNNIHISIPFVEGESMLLMLDKKGIEASTGSACSAFDLRPSHVLLAIGQSEEIIHGSIRFSLGRNTTLRDVYETMLVFPLIVKKLNSLSALTAHL